MAPNILVTGAAGYIGGSVVAGFLAGNGFKIDKGNITAAVRSKEQADAVAKLGINVLQLDLSDEKAVIETISRRNISIVIHTASSTDSRLALPLITALRQRKDVSGEEAYFIHTSGMGAFCEKTGWLPTVDKDTDAIFDTEKQLAESNPLRKTDVDVIEYAKQQGITSFIVIPGIVYGKGTGQWNQLSVALPTYVKASLLQKRVSKFLEDAKLPGVHVSDLTTLYGQIIKKILQKEPIPNGREGYYFALAHDFQWWEVLDHLAAALKARGLAETSSVGIWPNDETAAEAVVIPVPFVQLLFNSSGNMTSSKPFEIGWKPKWDKAWFLQNVDDEIDAVLELGEAKSSLIPSLFELVSK